MQWLHAQGCYMNPFERSNTFCVEEIYYVTDQIRLASSIVAFYCFVCFLDCCDGVTGALRMGCLPDFCKPDGVNYVLLVALFMSYLLLDWYFSWGYIFTFYLLLCNIIIYLLLFCLALLAILFSSASVKITPDVQLAWDTCGTCIIIFGDGIGSCQVQYFRVHVIFTVHSYSPCVTCMEHTCQVVLPSQCLQKS